jgi:hypothetical protein
MDLELLDRVAARAFEDCEAEWREVLGGLRLGMIYVPAIQRVLQEGRWKDAPNPMAYVRKSAVRAAVRLGIVDIRPRKDREVLACDLQYEDEEGQELDHDDRLGTALHRYQERSGREDGGDAHWAEDRLAESLYRQETHEAEDPEIDWERAGDLAGLDGTEQLVIELQLMGFGRRAALRACLTDDDRRYLQAAWKRFDRNKERLGEALENGEPAPARKGGAERPERELILMDDEGKLKISFRAGVPKGQV